jgi:NTP pyrophosphatase (non-canonical NTP hydrolase)
MNNMTPGQLERFGKMSEETGEIQQELGQLQQKIGKIAIHGLQPSFENLRWDNKSDLEREIGDFLAALQIMVDAGDLDATAIEEARQVKLPKIKRYMKHQNEIHALPMHPAALALPKNKCFNND